ncbi:hypothetical protein AB0B66_09185 [Catellatospora sp. NPDC049111]|uniref:hypothetical protein n=1 Tax=Catellatospora sp. NPDC049111 TaxID=3155271 RepID=UPI0033F5FCEF
MWLVLFVFVALAGAGAYRIVRQRRRTAAERWLHDMSRGGQRLAPRPIYLPADVVSMMSRFGRYEFGASDGSVDGGQVWTQLQAPLLPLAQHDPARLASALAERVLPVGGWAVVGAMRTIVELLASDFSHPARDALFDAGLAVLRSRGVPAIMLNGYEWRYWLARHPGDEPWLVGRPVPTPEQAPVRELDADEVRPVVRSSADRDANLIYVERCPDGGYRSVVDARESDEDANRGRWEGVRAPTLPLLYQAIAVSFQVPTYWHDPELAPYFPLPEPRWDP